jgi:dTDP-4-amino-4,6-dideoxygalactose transaminase
MKKLAISRNQKMQPLDNGNMFTTGSSMFKWPVANDAMRKGIVSVLDKGAMSGTDITNEFERKFAYWNGLKYALGHNTGTSAIHSAMYAVGLGPGDELICPSITYWASCAQAFSLGAGVVFADIDPWSLCINPDDIEHRITPRTKAIMVVHYLGYPADMERIMPIAKKHGLKVIEDVSHAHGSLYKGKMVGTFGDVAAYSLMSSKSFAIGEAGIMVTNSRKVYERAILFAHYERHNELTFPKLKAESGLPLGGVKYRMHQMSSVIGLEMLKNFPSQMREVDSAMNYFWDQLEAVPGIIAHRPSKKSNSTMGAWYAPNGFLVSDKLNGLSTTRFCEALKAEGVNIAVTPGCNSPLHKHRLFCKTDVHSIGKPTNFSGISTDLPIAEQVENRTFCVPWFKKFIPEKIDRYVEKFKLVVENHKELLDGDNKLSKINVSSRWAISPKKC